MAKVCEMCGKRTHTGNNRSHSNRATKRKFLPNLFKKKIFVPILGAAVRLKICTRCIRTAAKNA